MRRAVWRACAHGLAPVRAPVTALWGAVAPVGQRRLCTAGTVEVSPPSGAQVEHMETVGTGDGEAAAAAAASAEGVRKKKKKEKKEGKHPWQQDKAKKNTPVELDGSVFDLRVGYVQSIARHPDADSLYIEQIDVGEDAPREICSGLVAHYAEEDIVHQHVLVMCNLKPVRMRGVASYGMLLCSETADGEVRLCRPPEGSTAGDRITLPKYEKGAERPGQVPPKRVPALVDEFRTNAAGAVVWRDAPLTVEGKGVCTGAHTDANVR